MAPSERPCAKTTTPMLAFPLATSGSTPMAPLRPVSRIATAVGLAGAALAALTPVASADLRTPRLESGCETGFAYSEVRIGPFLVEGCNKRGNEQDGESARFLFKGNVEVNGLLVEPSSGNDPLVATISNGQDRNGRIVTDGNLDRSQSTRLVLDPRIAGERRRIVINNGPLHLEGSGSGIAGHEDLYSDMIGSAEPVAGLLAGERTAAYAGGGVIPRGAELPAVRTDVGSGTGSTALPVGGVPALLGLRLFEIEDVALGTDGMTFDAELKLGNGAPSSMRDSLGKATIELNDGEGMKISDLRFRIGLIGIDGIGGMENFRINYDGGRDEWSGGFNLELGTFFPGMEFSATVSASTGAPSAMRLAVEPLNVPLGPTGITLQSLRAGFDMSPLTLEGGAGIAAGPTIGGWAVLTADGDVTVALEPNFRFEATGSVRVFPTSQTSQIARGSTTFIYDSSGLISLSGDARYEALAAGIGISAQIRGSGAYSSSADVFNIAASATGRLELGFLGGFDVVELQAVVSSDGFGTCGRLLSFLSAGIGQQWDTGGLRLLTSCDLGPYRVNVARASRAERLQAGVRTTPFVIPEGVERAAIEVSAAAPGTTLRLIDPAGAVITTAVPGSRIATEELVAITSPRDIASGQPEGKVALLGLRRPKAGRYLLRTLASEPAITGVRVATDAKPLRADVRVERGKKPGERRLRTRVRGGLEGGDRVQYGFRTASGIEPIGRPVGVSADLPFSELPAPGRRQIVAQLVRDGVPVPGRVTSVGVHTPILPSLKYGDIVLIKRQGQRLQVRAKTKPGDERPQGFEYRVSLGARTATFRRPVGKTLKVWLPKATGQVRVEIHPIFQGRTLERVVKVVSVR